jgi:Secretion system C-terminal sorting domain
MKKITLILFIIFLNSVSNAQTTFQKVYGGTTTDNGNYVVQTTDGGYIIAGTTTSIGEGGRDVYVVKTNAAGDVQWTKTFGGATDNEYGYCVQQTSDGGYIVSGDAAFNGFSGEIDFYLIKLTATGDTSWTKTYGGNGFESAFAVRQTSDGGYIMCGQTPAFGTNNFKAYLIKVNTTGDITWSKAYDSYGYATGKDVQQTADGGYIFLGETDIDFDGSGDLYLIKTDALGNPTWSRAIGAADTEEASEVKQTPDGGYIVTGSAYGAGSLSRDMLLLKTNSLGVTEWAKTYGSTVNEVSRSVTLTTDGGYAICGSSWGFNADEDYEVYVVKTNASGVVQWSRTYGGPSLYGDYGFSIQQTNDNGYIITGEAYSFGIGIKNIYLIKTDATGDSGCTNQGTAATVTSNAVLQNISTTTTVLSGGTAANPATVSHTGGTQTDICATLSNSEETFEQGSILAYPNPFTDLVTIDLPTSNLNTKATIFDITGKSLVTFELNSQNNSMDLSNLSSGIYFCKFDSNTNTKTIKLVKK